MPTFPANSPIATVPSALARNKGRPDISFTANIQPEDRLLFIENNCPELPSKESELSASTDNVIGEFVVPINAIEGMTVVPAEPNVAWLK